MAFHFLQNGKDWPCCHHSSKRSVIKTVTENSDGTGFYRVIERKYDVD